MPPADSSPEWLEYDVRASSIKDFFDCSMRAEARHLLKIQMPSAGVARLGTAIHKGAAVYDQSVIAGAPVPIGEAVDACVRNLHAETNPDEPADGPVRWDVGERDEAQEAGTRAVLNYIEKLGSRRRYHAVEAKLERFPVAFPEQKVTINLTGHTDRVRFVRRPGADGYGISDIKSGATRCTKEGKVSVNGEKAQLAVYELIAEKTQNIAVTEPAEIIGASTAKHGTVSTVEVPNTRAALVGTSEAPGVLDYLARMLRTGTFPPNPSSKLCSPKFCPIYQRCQYHD